MPAPAAANRLTYDDDLFLRTRRVLGVPVVNQTIWRVPAPLDRDRLAALHRHLARGRLARVAVPPRVPGARPRWVRSGVVAPLVVDEAPVAPDAVLAWADAAVAGTDLDPVGGPGWALRAATTADGGTVLSFLTSHVVADGGAHLGAIVEAVRGETVPRLPVDDLAALETTRRDDLRDAAAQVGRAARGVATAVRRSRSPRPATPLEGAQRSEDTPPRRPAPGDEATYVVPTVVVDCPAEAWEAAARRHGGSANTLLIALTVEVLLATGRVEAGRPVRAAVPVNLREGAADLRSNATSGVSVAVPTTLVDGVGRVTDLAAVRDATRVELASRAAGTRHDPLEPLKPLLQVLPDRAVARLARDNAAPLCLASNLGELAEEYAAPLGARPSSVMMRSVTPGVTRGQMRRTRGGLSSWWSRHGDRATLSLVCLDPDLVPGPDGPARLRGTVLEAFARWEVPAEAW
ncbi:hypothetical protein GGQ22_05800 [Nocardioides sp. zg-579]|uniref:Condensation domain-containing protein n=1 Tax=Nocardioides marmotae TaxID=2663857 RepID=A0A6I3J881_9ACTN|nr:hypothetical protein [Nocardioides marmotae]MTB94589.1 hypothetical protein [Nocardioides marmotae]QKE01400.1 hypothetical protein HPC71_10185 [Nocardioides marmotae]